MKNIINPYLINNQIENINECYTFFCFNINLLENKINCTVCDGTSALTENQKIHDLEILIYKNSAIITNLKKIIGLRSNYMDSDLQEKYNEIIENEIYKLLLVRILKEVKKELSFREILKEENENFFTALLKKIINRKFMKLLKKVLYKLEKQQRIYEI
jgi:hypothetical protein